MKLSKIKSDIALEPHDIMADDYASQAEALYDLLRVNQTNGLTAAEIGSSIPNLRFPERLLPTIYMVKKNHLDYGEYPIATREGNTLALRLKLEIEPRFPTLERTVLQRFISNPTPPQTDELTKEEVMEYKISADVEFAMLAGGFHGGFLVLGANYLLQDVMALYKFGYVWQHELQDKELVEATRRAMVSSTTTGHEESVLVMPTAPAQQVLSPTGRQLRAANIAVNPNLTAMEQLKALEAVDKMQGSQRAYTDSKNESTGGANIQINVLGQSDNTEVEVIDIESD